MSASELLHKIEELPAADRQWLMEQLLQISDPLSRNAEETAWSNFSAAQLSAHYAPEDSIYDRE